MWEFITNGAWALTWVGVGGIGATLLMGCFSSGKVEDLQTELWAANYERNTLEAENAELRARIAPFDRDGDGKPGGSKPKGKA